MKHDRIMLATLAISILAAGQAVAVQDVSAASAAPEGPLDWLGQVQSLTDPEAGLIHIDAPDALARELETLSTDMQAAVALHDARWGMSIGVEGAEALARNGTYDFDRIDEVARPATPDWCNRDAPYVAIDAAGNRRIWQQCSGTPTGEDADAISVRRFWIEDTVAGDYRWLEFIAVSSTDTGSVLAELDTFSREALGAIARSIVIFPADGE
ncbi:hypothetical protein [Maricaulis sp.]|uniref:hypothetical protein n=1 Tax=Maricaulis sp. TaxID=1486257 RepID=UPI003A9434F3